MSDKLLDQLRNVVNREAVRNALVFQPDAIAQAQKEYELAAMGLDHAALLARLERAEAVLAKLPKGGDGLPIVVGGNHWYRNWENDIYECAVVSIADRMAFHPDDYPPGQRWDVGVLNHIEEREEVFDGDVYSSLAAAEKASPR